MNTSSKKKYGYNHEPRVSTNQIAEYLGATPARRKSIIRDAKYPKTAVVARYDNARNALKKHLSDAARSYSYLTKAINDLKLREESISSSAWVKDDSRSSIEAITSFQRSENRLGLNQYKFLEILDNQPNVIIDGVTISINLDLIVQSPDQKKAGGVIFMFSKAEASPKIREARGKAAAVVIYQFAQHNLKKYGEATPKLCMILDAFEGKSFDAGGGHKRVLGYINDSCEEIKSRWPTIEPPKGYDGPA